MEMIIDARRSGRRGTRSRVLQDEMEWNRTTSADRHRRRASAANMYKPANTRTPSASYRSNVFNNSRLGHLITVMNSPRVVVCVSIRLGVQIDVDAHHDDAFVAQSRRQHHARRLPRHLTDVPTSSRNSLSAAVSHDSPSSTSPAGASTRLAAARRAKLCATQPPLPHTSRLPSKRREHAHRVRPAFDVVVDRRTASHCLRVPRDR